MMEPAGFLHEMSLNFRNMRQADEMVDVVLVFGETRVKCHRLVLAAACEYFRLMFQTDMQEKAASEIAMKEVSSNTGLQLVEYLYSGNIEISTENAQELLAASDRLLLVDLKKMVGVFLCGQADTNNCVSLLNLARLYRLESLGGISQQFLTDHWKELIETEEIYQLAEDDLVALLITHSSDENSFLLLQDWARSSEGRAHRFTELLHNLKVHLFSKEFVCRTVMSEKLIRNDSCMNLIQQAMETLVLHQHQCLVVGDFKRNIWIGDGSQQWQPMRMPPPEISGYSACSSPDGFIVSGGIVSEGLHADSYAYATRTGQWRTLPPMSVARAFHASICDREHLMVIGGMKSANFYLDLVECLDLETLEWSEFPHLPKALLLPSVVYVQKQLFVVGGEPSSTTTSGDVYEFDSAERAWQPRCPMPQVYKGADAVSVDNKILVLGGVYRVCMQYDPCGDLWIQLQRSQFQHITGRAVVWKDKIVVCGGRDTDSIEEYDPCLDKWSTWNLKMPFEDMCFALIIKGNV